MAKRMKLLVFNYVEAKKAGLEEGYEINLVEPDNFEKYYVLFQPKHGVYRDQKHVLSIKTSYGNGSDKYEFPIQAPLVKFLTPVYHTNVSKEGSICLDILKESDKWQPTYGFTHIMYNILLLFDNPNNSSPFNSEASRDYVDCEKIFKENKKGLKLSVTEEEKLKDEAFEKFKTKADSVSKKIKLDEIYGKWFPSLHGEEESEEVLQGLEKMLEGLKPKKQVTLTKKEEDNVSEANKVSEVIDEDIKKGKELPTVNGKANRWAKYQKK